MDKCFKCGVSEDRALLFSAISEKGIVKICRKCSFEEDIPIMKYIEEKVEKRQTVHERLSRLSGIEMKNEEDKINIQISKEAKDESLMKIANENFRKNVLDKNPFGMIDNFHWVIMRARRAKKLNQKQFAEAIEESEEAIKMAEEGILPKNDFVLVNKIENYLGIVIREEVRAPKGVHQGGASSSSSPSVNGDINTEGKNSFEEDVEIVKEGFVQNVKDTIKGTSDKVRFDDTTTKTLTIADLQEMKQKREKAPQAYTKEVREPAKAGPETFSAKMFTKGKIFNKPDKIDLDKEDLSQEEIDKILFGK